MAFLSVLGGVVGNNCITLFIPNNAVAFIHFVGFVMILYYSSLIVVMLSSI